MQLWPIVAQCGLQKEPEAWSPTPEQANFFLSESKERKVALWDGVSLWSHILPGRHPKTVHPPSRSPGPGANKPCLGVDCDYMKQCQPCLAGHSCSCGMGDRDLSPYHAFGKWLVGEHSMVFLASVSVYMGLTSNRVLSMGLKHFGVTTKPSFDILLAHDYHWAAASFRLGLNAILIFTIFCPVLKLIHVQYRKCERCTISYSHRHL